MNNDGAYPDPLILSSHKNAQQMNVRTDYIIIRTLSRNDEKKKKIQPNLKRKLYPFFLLSKIMWM
jgi:hypothetical protein